MVIEFGRIELQFPLGNNAYSDMTLEDTDKEVSQTYSSI